MTFEREFQAEQLANLGELPGELVGYTLVRDPLREGAFHNVLPFVPPAGALMRLRAMSPGHLVQSRELFPRGAEPQRPPLELLGLLLQQLVLTSKSPGYLCPPYSAATERPSPAAQAVAALTTVVFRDVYIPPSRFGFRFVGLVQKVSDPLAAAESVWRISIDGRVVETVTGIASAATTPAPIFVHGRGPSRVDVSVQNVDALMAFDASPLLIGYRYPLPYDTPGLQGTSVE